MLPKDLGWVLYSLIKCFAGNFSNQTSFEIQIEIKLFRGAGELDNSAAVAAAKSLDNYFKDHVQKSLARIDQNNNTQSK